VASRATCSDGSRRPSRRHSASSTASARRAAPRLHTLALACGWDPGDEIIVSPISDYGTVQGFIAENIIPVFADSAPGTINFSADTIAPCITARTRGILCVHMTGLINDMDAINALAVKHGLLVIEDVCQAVFGEYKGRLAGALGHVAGFSFDAEKTMGSDIGGCMATNDDALAERARYMGQSRGPWPCRDMAGCTRTRAMRTACRTARPPSASRNLKSSASRSPTADRMIRYLYELLNGIPGIAHCRFPWTPTYIRVGWRASA